MSTEEYKCLNCGYIGFEFGDFYEEDYCPGCDGPTPNQDWEISRVKDNIYAFRIKGSDDN